eukprot:jgi/Mesvir1/24060/Mv10787-RA.1
MPFPPQPARAAIRHSRESIRVDKRWSRGYEVAAQCLLALHQNQEAENVHGAPSRTIEQLLSEARAAILAHKRAHEGEDSRGTSHGKLTRIMRCRELPKRPSGARSSPTLRSCLRARHGTKPPATRPIRKAGWLQEAIRLFERGASRGCTLYMASLARIYFHGNIAGGIAPDFFRAFAWARIGIDAGPCADFTVLSQPDPAVAMAQAHLGGGYQVGLGSLP